MANSLLFYLFFTQKIKSGLLRNPVTPAVIAIMVVNTMKVGGVCRSQINIDGVWSFSLCSIARHMIFCS